MRVALVVVVSLVIGVALGAGVMAWEPWADAPEEGTLYGTVVLTDGFWPPGGPGRVSVLGWQPSAGKPCTGTPRDYPDVGPGTELTVSDESDNVLATGRLGSGVIALYGWGDSDLFPDDDYDCEFQFEVPGVTAAHFYSIQVGPRAGPTYSHDELEGMDWTVAFELDGTTLTHD